MYEFFILLAIATILSFIKLINKPFYLMETFFHELSHGLAAVVTFGKINKIELNFDGSGNCQTTGGFRHLILISGYLGAAAFGYLIYYIGVHVKTNPEQAQPFLYGMICLFIFVTLMWVRNIKTLICMFLIGVVFYLPLKHELFEYTSMLLKFLGIYVCLSAIKAPFHLIDGKSVGDGAELFKITLIPEFIWIIFWVIAACYFMYKIYLLSVINEVMIVV